MRRTCRLRPSVIVISNTVLPPGSRKRVTCAGRVGPSRSSMPLRRRSSSSTADLRRSPARDPVVDQDANLAREDLAAELRREVVGDAPPGEGALRVLVEPEHQHLGPPLVERQPVRQRLEIPGILFSNEGPAHGDSPKMILSAAI